jgi:hypothetical protein
MLRPSLLAAAFVFAAGCKDSANNPPPAYPPNYNNRWAPPGAPPTYNPGAPPTYNPGAPPTYNPGNPGTPPPPPPPPNGAPPSYTPPPGWPPLPPWLLPPPGGGTTPPPPPPPPSSSSTPPPPFGIPGLPPLPPGLGLPPPPPPGGGGTQPPTTIGWDGQYRMPVQGRWRVTRTHYNLPGSNDQQLAVDIVVDADTPPQTPGHALAEYPSYGRPIVADGPGIIANVVDGIPDNPVPQLNPNQAYGNIVVIDHLNGEFTLYAHLIPGSIPVRKGDPVVMGQRVGSCGNTGNTTMPHLHWQHMNGPDQATAGAIPIRHLPYKKNGQMTNSRLDRGDVFEAQP